MKKAVTTILMLTALLFGFTALSLTGCDGGGFVDPGAMEYYSGGGTGGGILGGGGYGGYGGGGYGGTSGGNFGGAGGGYFGGTGGGNFGGGGGYGQSSGWPPQSVRNQYGIGGLNQPSGGSNFNYVTISEEGGVGVGIYFTLTNEGATLNHFRNWFTSNGWSEEYAASVYAWTKSDGSSTYGATYYPHWMSSGYANLTVVRVAGSGGGNNPGNNPGGTGSGSESDPITLSAGTWANGSVPSSSSVVWYSFNVTSGTRYYIWWNDYYDGNDTKTGDVKVSAYYPSGTSIFTNDDDGWYSPQSFTASSSGTVKIKVVPYGSSYPTGTFAVAYSTSSTRP